MQYSISILTWKYAPTTKYVLHEEAFVHELIFLIDLELQLSEPGRGKEQATQRRPTHYHWLHQAVYRDTPLPQDGRCFLLTVDVAAWCKVAKNVPALEEQFANVCDLCKGGSFKRKWSAKRVRSNAAKTGSRYSKSHTNRVVVEAAYWISSVENRRERWRDNRYQGRLQS